MGTLIHGIGASENLDTSGECVSISGMDISTLDKDGVITWEHEIGKMQDPNGAMVDAHIKIPSQVVGKILNAKKILSEEDCENENHLYFWNKIKTPYLYVLGELFDEFTDAAKDVAGKFQYDASKKNSNLSNVMNFSIEGVKLPNSKQGMVVTRSIARKVTLTVMPCNKAAIAELVPSSQEPKNDIDSLFKAEVVAVELFKESNSLSKVEALSGVAPTSAPGLLASEMMKAGPVPQGWIHERGSKSPGVHFSHPQHGVLSAVKQDNGEIHVKLNGAIIGHKGASGIHSNVESAGHHMKNVMNSIENGTLAVPKMRNAPSPEMASKNLKKAIDAGSALSAPSSLVQGAALGKESLQGRVKKSKWLLRAEQEYDQWNKKAEFQKFMQERMPKLTRSEIDAIGRTLAFNKSQKAEKVLSKFSDVMMASEKKK